MINAQYGNAINVTATGTINPQTGRLVGFYVNSTSSAVIALRDGGASGRVLCGSITPAIGFHPFPAAYGTDLHFTLVSGSGNLTFFVN